MSESEKLVGNSTVVETGSVVLGVDDDSFTVHIQGLTFTIYPVSDHRLSAINVEPVGAENDNKNKCMARRRLNV
jgi:hypothetical protein